MIRPSSLAYILLLACMWGPSFLLIKIAVDDFPPVTLSVVRVGVAVLFLLLIVMLQRVRFPKFGPLWGHLAVFSFFSVALPFTLINFAEQTIDSALAGVLNGLTPLATAALAHIAIQSERLTWNRTLGVLSGLLGFLVLLLPTLLDKSLDADSLSTFAVAVAALSYGVGIVYARRFFYGETSLAIPTMQMFLAFLCLLPFMWWLEPPWTLAMPKTTSWIAVVTLGIWGTALAYIVYFRILSEAGALVLSMVTYLLPLFALFLGVVFLQENIAWYVYLATSFIFLGLLLVNGVIQIKNHNCALNRS